MTTPLTDTDPLLTKEEVCALLNVKESWLNQQIQAGTIKHIRLGKKKFIRFRRSYIEEYLQQKEAESAVTE